MKLVKKRINFVVDRSIDINNEKVTEVKEIEKFKDGTNKEVTILDKKMMTLEEIGALLIVLLKEGYDYEEGA